MKTLYIDIESSPNVAHVWGLFNQTVSLAQVMETQRMICFAAKWRGEDRIAFYSEHHNGREVMLAAAHELLCQADVVVTYNGKTYDIPHLNREFVLAGMPPPAPFQQLDLLQVVKGKFRFTSNKLAHVTKELGLSGKAGNEGHLLWVKCMAGDDAAWTSMKRYNKQDVKVLEELHDKLIPWLGAKAPNVRLVDGESSSIMCPVCGSDDLRREGHAYTATGAYQRFQCRSCKSWSGSSRREYGTDVRSLG